MKNFFNYFSWNSSHFNFFADGYGRTYGLKNLSGYELNNFATVETLATSKFNV